MLDDTLKLCLKDLSENVTSELELRLGSDKNTKKLVYQSFGINPYRLPPNFYSVFSFFVDTPVNLLKDVFEALQLYDLLELLEQQTKARRPRTARSLRLALTLDEIKKLRNTANRPTMLHSCCAVLILAHDEDDSAVKGIKTFFTDLDSKSDVTIIQYRRDLFLKKGAELEKDLEKIKTAALTVIERWIQHQG